jgi:molecular chaperone DnaJ
VLKDEEKRRAYDQYGAAAFDGSMGGGGFDPNDIPIDMQELFEGVFHNFGFGAGGRGKARARGEDVEVLLHA